MASITNSNNLADKIFYLIREFQDRTEGFSEPVKKITRETKFVNLVQSLTEYGNSSVLESFKIRIEMEEDGAVSLPGKEESRA